MRCDEAAAALAAGESPEGLDIHLSACDECRALARDFAGLQRSFARAREEWKPSPAFRVVLPSANWRRLAAAACFLLLPLAAAAARSLRAPETPAVDVASLLDAPAVPSVPTDRQLLATLFLEESSR
jgi:predicted anti-sigma-YlaC factor YlaD